MTWGMGLITKRRQSGGSYMKLEAVDERESCCDWLYVIYRGALAGSLAQDKVFSRKSHLS